MHPISHSPLLITSSSHHFPFPSHSLPITLTRPPIRFNPTPYFLTPSLPIHFSPFLSSDQPNPNHTDAVHHYDENGLANHSAEPPEIQAIHEQEVEFVKAWLEDWVSVGA